MARLYEIAVHIGSECVDGRSNHGAWGHERQFHATRESAEEAVARLRDGGHWGCSGADLRHRRADACRLPEQRHRRAGVATGLPAGRYRRSGHHGGLTVSCKRRFGIVGGSGLYRFNGLFDAVLNFALNLPHDFGVAGFFLQARVLPSGPSGTPDCWQRSRRRRRISVDSCSASILICKSR